jgi:tetratricopeptide (TPR) repeat protein
VLVESEEMDRFTYLRNLLLGIVVLLAIPVLGVAQPLDDVSLEYESQGIVATIHLTGPVQYLRHFPESHGKTLEIYYDRVKDVTNNEAWQDNEVRNSPPSTLIPSFTVTTRDQSTNPKLVIEFSREADFSVAAGKDNRSLLVTIRPDRQQATSDVALPLLPTIRPEVKPAPGKTLSAQEAAAADIEQQARALMVQARDALQAKKYDDAVELLNKLLLLPPNDYTQDGQEWVGVARERDGQPDKARVEYDLYLKLYPQGAGAARVAKRMARLGKADSESPMSVPDAARQQAPTLMTFGSISSHYYYGKSKIDTTNTFNGVSTTDSQSLTDQSMLITSVDASERYRNDNVDSRLVFRDMNTRNFVSGQPSQNQVSAAYGEIKGRADNYLLRVGRQSPVGGGVLGRFDGLAASYGEAQDMRVNAVAGALVDYSPGSKPRFFGASVDKGNFSFYGINQTVDGVQDRRAVGSEFRYFDDKNSAYGLLDYDTYFKAVNAVQFMGMTKQAPGLPANATLTFMLDHRKAPSLSIRNALNGATVSSISDLLQTLPVSSVRDLALARTAISNMGQVGITYPVREKWQVGGDFRLTNTTGLDTSGQTIDPATGLPISQGTGNPTPQGFVQTTPGIGLERSLTGQVIGSGLYKLGDIWSGNVTFTNGASTRGQSIFFSNHTPVSSLWLMDTTLMYSSYKDTTGGTTKQFMPMVRGSYRFMDRFTFDADCGFQRIDYSGPQSSTKQTRLFFSTGLTWDF